MTERMRAGEAMPSSDQQATAATDSADRKAADSVPHTPGPWRLDEMACYIWAHTTHGEMPVGQVRGWGHLTGAGAMNLPEAKAEAIQRANGRLLAAAPDLLAALKALIEEHGIYHTDEFVEAAIAAIAKAEGTE